MDPISQAILEVAKTFGVSPVAASLLIPVTIMIANRVARVIPDTATGWLKYVRLVAVILGAHVKDNSGVPAIKDADGAVIRRTTEEQAPESTEETQGVLLLDAETMKPDMFRRGVESMQRERESGYEG